MRINRIQGKEVAMLYGVLGAIGLFVGMIGYRDFGAVFGLVLGLMLAEILVLRKRLGKLEKGPGTGKQEQAPEPADRHLWKKAAQPPPPKPQPQSIAPVDRRDAPALSSEDDLSDLEADLIRAQATSDTPVAHADHVTGDAQKSKESFAGLPSQLGRYLKDFFTTGNVVTKIGVIVLFFGFAFLLKYAAQRNLVPIEFRLIGVFLGGLALLGVGWRLRERQMMYGLLLQGCGVGVLYLTIFASARFYQLIPYGFSFGIMVCLVILSGILAVLQDARYLALFGIVGGFLAPVLMSKGSGSHVVLFSYYALLNIGIAGIAWYKAWRELNVAGFIFTFGIASLWGGRYYQPGYFSTTEPFLVFFFLCYVFIAVLFASRQPVNLKGYVDGTLVFGLPIVAFGLQYGIVRNFPYGMAISALTLGLFYILLATLLWRRKAETYRLLAEAFLAFGVVFGSLAIPLALDGRWTSAAWAVEGAALLWIGVRQKRLLPRIFGILLQACSGTSFLMAMDNPFQPIAVMNSFFIGCLLISLAALFAGGYLSKKLALLRHWERYLAVPLMMWGLAWWFGGALHEIEQFVGWQEQGAAAVMHAALSFFLMEWVSRRWRWKQLAYPTLLLLPVMFIFLLYQLVFAGRPHLFAGLEWMAWLIAFAAQYHLLYHAEKAWPKKVLPLWHCGTLWLLMGAAAIECAYFAGTLLSVGPTWQFCIRGVVPALFVLTLLSKGEGLKWPIRHFREDYLGIGIALPVLYLLGWTVLANFTPGDPVPLPYVPILNPVVISQISILAILYRWIEQRSAWFETIAPYLKADILNMILFGAGFVLLNAIVARCLHFWFHVPYTLADMFDSLLFHAALSILWGVTALGVTLVATRKGSRAAWVGGAAILSLVVLKLFFVDLAGTGTVARIVSFLGVGSLMLLIGYFSPLPPAHFREDS
jgi:uncharacterized membrane protein